MQYPPKPKTGDPIRARDMAATGEAARAARITGGSHLTLKQSVNGVTLASDAPTSLILAQTTTAAVQGSGGWWYADAKEMWLAKSTYAVHTRLPQRNLRVASNINLGLAGRFVVAWWDATGGHWVSIPLDTQTSSSTPSSGNGSGSGSGSGNGSGSGGGAGNTQCCWQDLCVVKDSTGNVIDLKYWDGSQYITVPVCSGPGSGSGSGSSSGSGSGPSSGSGCFVPNQIQLSFAPDDTSCQFPAPITQSGQTVGGNIEWSFTFTCGSYFYTVTIVYQSAAQNYIFTIENTSTETVLEQVTYPCNVAFTGVGSSISVMATMSGNDCCPGDVTFIFTAVS